MTGLRFPGRPVVVELEPGVPIVRVYSGRRYPDGAAFRFYGPHPRGRWDHHPDGPPTRHPGHGILYSGATLRCCVAEAFGDTRRVAPAPAQRLAVLSALSPLPLIDTRGLAAVELGVPAGALRSRDRALTQAVSRALYATTDAVGILYEGWNTGESCVALWERAAGAIKLLDDRSLHEPVVAVELAVLADELYFDWAGPPSDRGSPQAIGLTEGTPDPDTRGQGRPGE